MKIIPQGRYSREFREEVVKHVIEQGLSVPEVSRRLDVPKSTISHWVRASKDENLGNIGKNRRELSDVDLELAKLRRELDKVKMERNILKKSSGIFRQGVDMKYATIEELRLQYPVTDLCQQLMRENITKRCLQRKSFGLHYCRLFGCISKASAGSRDLLMVE